jgi:dTDP-4-dehydrorhamnose 3,5-epimerase-like enzyme
MTMNNKKWSIINLSQFNDDRGSLIPIELDENFPFEVKRMYFVRAKNNQTIRGAHAHIIEEEVFMAVSGKILARIHDGTTETEIWLDDPTTALYVKTNCWHEFTQFSDDAVLLALSSTHYLPGETNYVMDKEKFLSKNTET